MKPQKKIIKVKRVGGDGRERKRACRGDFLFFIISSLRFFFISTKIGPQVFIGAEGKVDSRSEGYTWVPKSWSFVKLHEVGIFSYLVYFFG